MAKQLFVNNFEWGLAAPVLDTAQSPSPDTELGYGIIQLPASVATALPVWSAGDWLVLTLFRRSGSQELRREVVKVLGVNETDYAVPEETRLRVLRAQEGTGAQAFSTEDFVSARLTAQSVGQFLQAGSNLSDVANATQARSNLGLGSMALRAVTEFEPTIAKGVMTQYWSGEKTWRDLSTDVRAAALTGLSTLTNAVITASDSVLGALGKLQKQVTDWGNTLSAHTSNQNNPHGTTKAQVGLGNVDNTADLNKPVSTAMTTALSKKADIRSLPQRAVSIEVSYFSDGRVYYVSEMVEGGGERFTLVAYNADSSVQYVQALESGVHELSQEYTPIYTNGRITGVTIT